MESGEIDEILKKGAEKADMKAQEVLVRVKKKLGLVTY